MEEIDLFWRGRAKYPNVNVKLAGEDGNAWAIMARVSRALRKAGVTKEEIDEYMRQSKSGDYDNLLRVVFDWVNIIGEDEE